MKLHFEAHDLGLQLVALALGREQVVERIFVLGHLGAVHDASRVQDILTALRWMQLKGVAHPALHCTGKAAIWCTFAAAVSPIQVGLDAPLGSFQGSDADFERDFFVPGIQRAGGMAAARRLVQGQ